MPRSKKQKRMSKRAAKQLKKKQQEQFLSAQDSIFYDYMMQDGLCVLGDGIYSRSFQFDDINYRLSYEENQKDICKQLSEVYNYLDADTFYQLLLVNRTGDRSDFMQEMLYTLRGDRLDTYRHEVNKVLTERGIDGNNSIIRSKYVTLGVTADDRRLAAQQLSRMESDISQHFKTIGSALHRLDGEQRLDVLNALLKPEEPLDFLYDDLVLSGKTTKDFICPSSFDFKDRRTFRFGDKIGMVLYASKLPDRMTDDLLYDISDLPFNLALSLHVQAEDQNKALDYVRKQIAFMDEEAVEKQRNAYNDNLKGTVITDPFSPSADQFGSHSYHDILNTSNGIMAYIEIESIHVYLPIYHGTSEETLDKGIGHIYGTSLPVGGTSTHSVLVGHTGLPGKTLFNDIDKLAEGDTFTIHVVGKSLTYTIDQIKVVEPNDISALQIEDGKEYVTLLTCTPYGVNTHRLLVRGARLDESASRDIPTETTRSDDSISHLFFSTGFLLLFLLMLAIVRKKLLKGVCDP